MYMEWSRMIAASRRLKTLTSLVAIGPGERRTVILR